jgi:hypothetical protein
MAHAILLLGRFLQMEKIILKFKKKLFNFNYIVHLPRVFLYLFGSLMHLFSNWQLFLFTAPSELKKCSLATKTNARSSNSRGQFPVSLADLFYN